MARFNIRQVEAFRAVVTLGSMTKAAELLGVSQPAVSRLIVDFEAAVGFKLFRRRRSGAAPTDDARLLFEQVEKLFIGIEELHHHVQAIRTLVTGTVSIVAMDIYANGLLPPVISRFRERHPGIAVRLESQPHDRIGEWVAARRSEIGVATLPVAGVANPAHTLLRRPAMCVFPAKHAFAGRRTVDARDLDGRTFVSFLRGTPFRYEIDAILNRAGVEPVRMVEAATHEAVCNLVAAGAGVSIVSPFSPHLRRSDAIGFRPFTPEIPVTVGMIAEEADLTAAGRAFHAFVLEHVAGLEGGQPSAPGPDIAADAPDERNNVQRLQRRRT